MTTAILSKAAAALVATSLWAAEPPPEPKPLSRNEALAAAEAYVAKSGHAEPVEAKAAGARLDSGVWFIGFRSIAAPTRIRGVAVPESGGAPRRLNQSLTLDWLAGPSDAKKQQLLGEEDAKAAAVRFVKKAKLKAGKPLSVDEAPADPGRHPDGAWRVSFAAAAASRGKAKKDAAGPVVIVDRKTGEARLAELAPKR